MKTKITMLIMGIMSLLLIWNSGFMFGIRYCGQVANVGFLIYDIICIIIWFISFVLTTIFDRDKCNDR